VTECIDFLGYQKSEMNPVGMGAVTALKKMVLCHACEQKPSVPVRMCCGEYLAARMLSRLTNGLHRTGSAEA
jgi:hypothetical protein